MSELAPEWIPACVQRYGIDAAIFIGIQTGVVRPFERKSDAVEIDLVVDKTTSFRVGEIIPATMISVSSLNVGVWTTYTFNVTVPTSPWDRISAYMFWYSNFGADGGRTRIGKFQLYMSDNG